MKKILCGLFLMVFILFIGNPLATEAVERQQPPHMALNGNRKTLNIGQFVKLKVSISGNKEGNVVKWTSSNKKIVSVTSKGKIKGIGKGTAKITAYLKGNRKVKAVCKVVVVDMENEKINITVQQFENVMRRGHSKVEVIESYEAMTNYINKMNQKFLKGRNPYLKKLKSYNKSFFKKNMLCLFSVQSVSTSQKVDVEGLKVRKSLKGKLSGIFRIKLEKQGPDKVWTTDMRLHNFIAELKKSKGTMLSHYKVDIQ